MTPEVYMLVSSISSLCTLPLAAFLGRKASGDRGQAVQDPRQVDVLLTAAIAAIGIARFTIFCSASAKL